jgi:hypothetical protein
MSKISEKVFLSLDVSEKSGVPILFMSNPGMGKTTLTELWAKEKGYEVITLIGSQRTNEDILGYMINNNGTLVTAKPDWFNEIKRLEAEGKRVLLFIDELSTASEMVQGSLLQLIFQRKVGGFGEGSKLPNSTLVVAAANYKGNLSELMTLLAPVLNRFMIVNLVAGGFEDFKEFLLPIDLPDTDRPIQIDVSSLETEIKDKLFKELASVLDLSFFGTDLSNIYLADGPIYNFISGRTLHYLAKVLLVWISWGDVLFTYMDVFYEHVLGLIGAGNGEEKLTKEVSAEYLQAVKRVAVQYVKDKETKTNNNIPFANRICELVESHKNKYISPDLFKESYYQITGELNSLASFKTQLNSDDYDAIITLANYLDSCSLIPKKDREILAKIQLDLG